MIKERGTQISEIISDMFRKEEPLNQYNMGTISIIKATLLTITPTSPLPTSLNSSSRSAIIRKNRTKMERVSSCGLVFHKNNVEGNQIEDKDISTICQHKWTYLKELYLGAYSMKKVTTPLEQQAATTLVKPT